jgi:hypothetical protein
VQRCKKYTSKQRKKKNNHVGKYNLALVLSAIQMAFLPFGEAGGVVNAPLSPY